MINRVVESNQLLKDYYSQINFNINNGLEMSHADKHDDYHTDADTRLGHHDVYTDYHWDQNKND